MDDTLIYSKGSRAQAGKGDARRPQQVSTDEFADNWARIFGKPRRPGRRHSIMDPVFYRPCPRCHNSTSGDCCSNCGDALPPLKS